MTMLDTVFQDFHKLQQEISNLVTSEEEGLHKQLTDSLDALGISLQQLMTAYQSLKKSDDHPDSSESTYKKLERIISRQAEEIKQLEEQLKKEHDQHRRTIIALSKSENRLQTTLRHCSDLITILEPDGQVRYHSPALERILGYKPEEMIGKVHGELFHPDDIDHWRLYFAKLLEEPGLAPPIEYRVLHQNGSWIYMEAIANSLLQDATINGIIISARDITERKEVEAALVESESRYRSISHLTSDFAYSFKITANGTPICEWLTHAFTTITGYTSEELEALGWLKFDYIHPHDKKRVLQELKDSQGTCNQESVYRLITKTGEVRWVRDCRQIIRDETDNRILRIYGACQNITEQKEAEMALKATNQALEAVIQSSPLPIVMIDSHAVVKVWNPAAEKMFGWTEEEVFDQTIPTIPRNESKQFYHLLKSVLSGEVLEGIEVRCVRKDGQLVDLSLWTASIRDGDGNICGSLRIYSDISERKLLEAERKKLEDIKNMPIPFWARYVRS